MAMRSQLFTLHGTRRGHRIPWAESTGLTLAESEPCAQCGQPQSCVLTGLSVDLHCPSREWPDIVHWQGPRVAGYLFSDRVLDVLTHQGIVDRSASIEAACGTTRVARSAGARPRYFAVEVPYGLEVDLELTRIKGRMTLCSACDRILDGLFDTDRLVPLLRSWDGADLFTLRRPRLGRWRVFCSLRFVELAREHRWKGFRFERIDADRQRCLGWEGVDYLAKKWPPQSWYPPRASDGRSPQAWLEMYNSVRDGGKWWDAWKALLDLGEEVLPLVLQQFESNDQDQRLRAARLLLTMGKRGAAEVPPTVLARADELVPPELK